MTARSGCSTGSVPRDNVCSDASRHWRGMLKLLDCRGCAVTAGGHRPPHNPQLDSTERHYAHPTGVERKRYQMRTALLVGVIIGCLATNASATSNLNLSKSNINREFPGGQFVTATADISGAVSQLIYTIPPSGDFVLTQICTGISDGGVLVQASAMKIAYVGSGLCQVFTPGVILSPGQRVTCTTFSDAATFCTIMGVFGPVPPASR